MTDPVGGGHPVGGRTRSASATTDFWPLVGRDHELESVCAAVRAGTTPVVVTGEAGIGKTRLVRESLEVMAGEGIDVEWAVAGAAARSISLGALAPWLGSPSGSGIFSPPETGAALRAQLQARHGPRRVVLVVDDAQWLDEASASVVVELASSRTPQLLLTVRSDEELPPSLKALVGGEPMSTIRLLPLVEADVRRLVPEILAGPLDPASVHRLWRRSEGNPLWLRELVLDALTNGRLVQQRGVWHWDDAVGGGPGPRLVDLLQDRLSVGDPETARWLDLIALAEPLPYALAEGVIGSDSVAGLIDTGLVVTDDATAQRSLRLSHPLFGELLRAGVPPLRARNLWRSLVQSQEEHPDPTVAVRRQAAWRLEADLPIPPAMGAVAAHDALDHADPELAERVARGVASSPGDPTVGPGVLEDLAVARVEALALLGRWDEVLEETGRLESASLDGNQQARLAAVRLWPHLFIGDLSAADRFLAAAAAEATTPDLRNAATTHRATVALFAGNVDGCHDIAWGLIDRPALDDFSRRWSVRAVVSADALRGSGQLAVSTAEAELSRSGRLELSLAPVELVVGYCLALWRSGRLVRALEVAETFHRESRGLRDANRSAASLMLVGISHLEIGRVVEAEASLDEASRTMGRQQPLFFLPFAFAELARARVLLGDTDGATRALEAVEQAFFNPLPVFTSALDRSRAWQLADLGLIDDAVGLLLVTAARVGAQGQMAQEAVLAHDVVRMGRPGAVAPALERLARGCDGDLVPLYAAHARAALGGEGSPLESVASAAAALGAGLLAAELWAEAAVAYRAAGRASRADRCTEEARRWLEPCGPVRSPALDRLTWQRQLLTPREAEVATLARRGMSNREIAAETGCTIRTVENHLGRIYVKLGVAGRHELPATLR